MKKDRRSFIKIGLAGAAGVVVSGACANSESEEVSAPAVTPAKSESNKPIVLSTWNHGMPANEAAMKVLSAGGTALDAVEVGVRVSESDPDNQTVGLGGLPDRDGKVTLDACIMNHKSDCGSVAFLQNIENPISVARKVMEDTPHVMLAGKGAYDFAIEKGFEHTNLLTEPSKKAWKEWLEKSQYKPIINRENHDTIGMIAMDADGNLSGACTTSGLAYKLHGRVGDSPIIGAGLFLDNEVGAACATGVGEAVIRVSGSAMVVELMRHGYSPEDACKEVVHRIMAKHKNMENTQVGFLALSKDGTYGGYSVYAGFNYAVSSLESSEMEDAKYEKEW